MVEIESKYKIYEKKFGYVNWIGFFTLINKEISRFIKVAGQTLFAPVINVILFFTILNIAIGDGGRADVLGTNFMNFLLPGLIAQQAMTQAFSHSSSSIILQKVQTQNPFSIKWEFMPNFVSFKVKMGSHFIGNTL